MMLGWLFYLFKKYGNDITQMYNWAYGRLEFNNDLSGKFIGYYDRSGTSTIFIFGSVREAIDLFRKEIERLDNG